MATQQHPEAPYHGPGFPESRFVSKYPPYQPPPPARPLTERKTKPRQKSEWSTGTSHAPLGPVEPQRRQRAKPRPVNHHAEYERPKGRLKGTTRCKGSRPGVRGVLPSRVGVLEQIPIDNATDAGGIMRRQRRALNRTAEAISTTVGVWGTTLLDMERGREMKLSTLVRVLDGLGLRLFVTAKP